MLIFSDTIFAFLHRVTQYAKDILTQEIGVTVRRSRFEYKGMLYPLHLVVFEKKNLLGYFEHHTYQIGLHKQLIYQAKTPVLKNLIRHELAHYFVFLDHGTTTLPHGMEFKNFCRKQSWDQNVLLAQGSLDQENDLIEGDLATEKLITKIQKLLSLADSENTHEAELATLKANQLLLKHSLQVPLENNDQPFYVKRVLEASRRSAKLEAIFEILSSFCVQPVFNQGQGKVWLEVTGHLAQVQVADYVAQFLNEEFERQWDELKKSNPQLKGRVAKNSFFRGLAQGYQAKHKSSLKGFNQEQTYGLIQLQDHLNRLSQLAYGRLSSRRSQQQNCQASELFGRQAGKKLSIRRGLDSASKIFLLN